MDLCIFFKKGSFKKLSEMYNAVYDFLNTTYKKSDKDLIEVREQKVSVGLEFFTKGETLLFDITPGRKTDEDEKDGNINLFVTDDDDERNWMKTNIEEQIEKIKGKDSERECIRLLKVWKFHRKFKIKSILIELITIKAFDELKIGKGESLWDKLRKVIEFIRDRIEDVELIDPGNSANNVAKTLSDKEKSDISGYMKNMLNQIESDSEKLSYYFPLNEKYNKEEDTYEGNPKKSATILAPSTFG